MHINYFIKTQLPLNGGTDCTEANMQYTSMFYQVLNECSYKIYVCMWVHKKFFTGIWKDYSLISEGIWMSQHILTLLLLLNTDFDRP